DGVALLIGARIVQRSTGTLAAVEQRHRRGAVRIDAGVGNPRIAVRVTRRAWALARGLPLVRVAKPLVRSLARALGLHHGDVPLWNDGGTRDGTNMMTVGRLVGAERGLGSVIADLDQRPFVFVNACLPHE